ncbi:class I SAM-dependent methyltransferase [Gilvimarinus algae]|uniref:Class I SAM-dependent methyltransferase n=1 Tax=Gilvimarinus algae TaxID=3058037 RepID=A0ABT8TDN5_9GAMM|nr:class I SAM-dependent methyltransferase [Gilvimarinus sp. SDUM040014]MDO3382158.1 class I SAM-dependent methyltransferase [Gilvimarinus sp. SDUM040014]
MTSIKTCYDAHEGVYKRAKQRGAEPPWGIADENREFIEHCREHLRWRDAQGLLSERVLELGCGTGVNLLAIYRPGMRITGVDISATAIQWAIEAAETSGVPACYRTGNVLDASFVEEGAYDLVLDGHCWHCIIGERDRESFLANAYRALKSGGSLVMETMVAPVCYAIKPYADEQGRVVHNGIAARQILPLEEILASLNRRGFEGLSHRLMSGVDAQDQTSAIIEAIKR